MDDQSGSDREKYFSLFLTNLDDILSCLNKNLQKQPMIKFFLDKSISFEDKLSFAENVLSYPQRELLSRILTDYLLRQYYSKHFAATQKDKKYEDDEYEGMTKTVLIRELKKLYSSAFNRLTKNNNCKMENKTVPPRKLRATKILLFDSLEIVPTNLLFNEAHIKALIEHYIKVGEEEEKTKYCSGIKTTLYNFQIMLIPAENMS